MLNINHNNLFVDTHHIAPSPMLGPIHKHRSWSNHSILSNENNNTKEKLSRTTQLSTTVGNLT